MNTTLGYWARPLYVVGGAIGNLLTKERLWKDAPPIHKGDATTLEVSSAVLLIGSTVISATGEWSTGKIIGLCLTNLAICSINVASRHLHKKGTHLPANVLGSVIKIMNIVAPLIIAPTMDRDRAFVMVAGSSTNAFVYLNEFIARANAKKE